MPDVEALEIEIDEDAPAFRRRLAVAVVLITLFGAVIAYLHEQNSNFEDNASRDAEIAAIQGFGHQVDASTEFLFDYRVFVQRQLLERRRIVAATRGRLTTNLDLVSLYASDTTRWEQLRDTTATDIRDDRDAIERDNSLQTEPDKRRLAQQVFAGKANDYGDKADAYVALLTVLAVSLFLIGLSLTVSGRGRYFLAIPGVGVAVICMAWALLITTQDITRITDRSIELTAEGRELEANGDPVAAIGKYKAAIAESPEFGPAWSRLSGAEFAAGAAGADASASSGSESESFSTDDGATAVEGEGDKRAPITDSPFQSLSDPDATKRAVEAGEKALSLGESNPTLLSDVGFFHFAIGEYDRAEELHEQALASNDLFPPFVFNLGVVQVAKGERDAARETYESGIAELKKAQDSGLSAAIIAAARTDLEIAVTNTPDSADLAQEMKNLLALAEAPLRTTDPVPDGAPDGASVSEVTISTDRFRVLASYEADGFEQDTPLINVWYFRPLAAEGAGPFSQQFLMDTATFTGDSPVTTSPVENGDCLPGGDYRVEVYAGSDLVASAEQQIADSPLGELVVAGDEELGFTMCHPIDWQQSDDIAEPGSLGFENPADASQIVAVFSFPTVSDEALGATNPLDTAIQQFIADLAIVPSGPPELGEEFLGRTVDGFDVNLPTTTVSGNAEIGFVRITGSLGSDGVVRMVVLTADDADDLETNRSELINSIRFLRVPDTVAPSGG